VGTIINGNLKVTGPDMNGVMMSRNKIVFPDGSSYDAVTRVLKVTRHATFNLYQLVPSGWISRLFGSSGTWQKFAEIKNGNGHTCSTRNFGVAEFHQI
jgi:hypothetical protein